VAKFTLAPDLAPRVVTVPEELARALNEVRPLRKWFDRLSHTGRKWLSDFVSAAKSPETRRKRADRVAEQLLEAMEAELELPPLIRLAFNRNPGAEQAWYRMSERQRRGHLLAIFHNRTPQARLKRIEKIIEQLIAPEVAGLLR
jgi:uncharacterized protein YdeI (YjbR/CyaY-like superfamily)